MNETYDSKTVCSICEGKTHLIPKAGSGTVIHWVCLECVNHRELDVLPEYIENIRRYGHWHR